MFNIKQLVNKITDKANVPPRAGESSASVLNAEEQHSAEGFLCPPCMKAFPSPEALEEHYLKAHPMEEGAQSENVQLLRQEIESLQTSLVEEKSMSEELKKEILKIQTEITRNEVENASAMETWEGNNSLLKSEVTLLRQQLTDELEHTSELRKEKELLKEKLLLLASQNDALASDNKSLQSQLNHRNTIDDAAVLRQELVSVQRLMDQVTLEKEKELHILHEKVTELEKALEDSRKIQEQSQVELEKAAVENQQLAKYTDENYQLKRDLADSMAAQMKKDAEIGNLKEENELAQQKISGLDAQMMQLVQEKHTQNQSTEKLETTESEGNQLRSENMTLKAEVEKLQSQNADLSKNVHNLKLKIEKCEADGNKLVETHTAERKFVEVKFSEYDEKLKDKDEELKKIKHQHSSSINQKDAEISRINKDLKALQGQLDAKVKELEALQVTKASLEAKISQLEKDRSELQSECKKVKEELLSLEDRSKVLANQIEERLKSNEELQKRLEECKSDVDVKTATIASLEDALKNLKLSLDEKEAILQSTVSESSDTLKQLRVEFDSQKKSLENDIMKKKAQIKTLEESLDDRVQQISQLQSSLSETEDFASQTTSKVKSLEAKIQEVEVLNSELKYKLKSSDEEKALLAERCLTEQSKAEASHQAYEECKRKLEDSVAALQELGRENQSLQIESAKLQGRKWADDSVVNTCTGCVKEFTLTIRKHHCRHCGQIFCNDCSSRTASVPSSKKPVRVCEVCYQELTLK